MRELFGAAKRNFVGGYRQSRKLVLLRIRLQRDALGYVLRMLSEADDPTGMSGASANGEIN